MRRMTADRKTRIAIAWAVSVTLLASCAGREPITPTPYDRADTSNWFGGIQTPLMSEPSEYAYNEAREAYDAGRYEKAIPMFRQLAEDGLPQGAYELGKAYRYGNGVPQDKAKAAAWLIAAVQKPSDRRAHAWGHLGTMFLEGEGVPKDQELAFELLRHAWDAGYTNAAVPLAKMYAHGLHVKQNRERAAALAETAVQRGDMDGYIWLLRAYQPEGILGHRPERAKELAAAALDKLQRRAENDGDINAMRDIAIIYQEGLGVPKDRLTAISWMQRAAEAGEPSYLVNMAEDMLQGTDGYEQDADRAIELLQLAAQRYRHPEAALLLGQAYNDGLGVPRDLATAREWLEKSVDRGSPRGKLALGRMLAVDREDNESVERAVALFEEAGEAGYVRAWGELGELHLEQSFPGADPATGVEYLRRAHRAGIPSATATLGQAYLEGMGVERDAAKAEEFLKQAADAGQVGAMANLGRGYLEGTVLKRDPELAQKYLMQAANNGHTSSQFALGRAMLTGELPGGAEKGREIVQKFAVRGDTFAMLELARAFRDGNGVKQDNYRARYWFEQAAAAGAEDAKDAMASMVFDNARGGDVSASKLREAAGMGHPGAMAMLGRAYLEGSFVKRNPETGVMWLEKAVAQGHAGAAATLGRAKLLGLDGVRQDVDGGKRLLETAVAAGRTTAQRALGYHLITGQLIKPEPSRGEHLLRQAAMKRNVYAMKLLGEVYLEGTGGVKQQPKKAEVWLTRAADAGDTDAMARIAEAYLEGKPFGQDAEKAQKWFEAAIKHGDNTSRAAYGTALVYGRNGIKQDTERGIALLKEAVDDGHPGAMAQLGRMYLRGEYTERRVEEGGRLLYEAAKKGHPTAKYALAKAYLKSQGLPHANREYAETWLRSVLGGSSDMAVQTLLDMLEEANLQEPPRDQS